MREWHWHWRCDFLGFVWALWACLGRNWTFLGLAWALWARLGGNWTFLGVVWAFWAVWHTYCADFKVLGGARSIGKKPWLLLLASQALEVAWNQSANFSSLPLPLLLIQEYACYYCVSASGADVCCLFTRLCNFGLIYLACDS